MSRAQPSHAKRLLKWCPRKRMPDLVRLMMNGDPVLPHSSVKLTEHDAGTKVGRHEITKSGTGHIWADRVFFEPEGHLVNGSFSK